jgi:poly(3-hydroxybutyrate) depolymerase
MSAIRIAVAILFAAVVLQAQMPPGPAMSPEAAVANLEQNQTAQSLSQILRTLQTNLKVSESVKAEVDKLVAEAASLQNAGNAGEARRRLVHAIALQRGLPWDNKAEFAGSLLLRTSTMVVDSSRTFYAQLTQGYWAPYAAPKGLQLHVSLVSFGTPRKVVRELGTFAVTSRDLIEDPCNFSADLNGVADGPYKLAAELADGATVLRSLTLNILTVQNLEGQRAAIEQRLAKIKGGESTKATIRYPFDYARVINLGQRNLIAPPNPESAVLNEYFDFSAQIRNSLALLKSLESGKEPLVRAKGEHERHYAFAEAGEIIPYTVYVPAKYDGKAKLPLVVLLHGGGADNNTYFKRRGPVLTQEAEKHGFVIVAPMGYRPGGGWGAMSPGYGPANLLATADPARARMNELSEKDALNVMELVANEYGVDRSRIYLMGNSMGGFGTWYLGAKHADRWAAIAPAAGTSVGEGFPIERLKGLPIMYTNGEKDMTVRVEGARTMMAFLKEKGFDIPYNEIKDGTHDMAVWVALPTIFDFFEKHRK